MQPWLFVSASGQQLSATEPEVPTLARSGQIGPQTLMWRDGLAQWVPAASVFPALFAGPPAFTPGATQALTTAHAASGFIAPADRLASPDPATIRRLAAPLMARKGWIKLVGILLIVGGVLSIPLGLILIFAGVSLLKVPGLLERAHATGDLAALEEANKQMSTYFLLRGILMLIYLCLLAAIIVILILSLGAGMVGVMSQSHSSAAPPPVSEVPLPSDQIRPPESPAPATQ